ncbi:integrase [Tenacibaculum aiptasiae]|uniref:Integrase n=1 Tax=Tenacibaculum aiptasiae TaxID=426481 RepID=A0A7J5AST4_9FLAO|nr:DinB family protein [Tenacibaculum aiptasiae]KAB1160696.1 integrase [Tenacibaculum aiptasiae]
MLKNEIVPEEGYSKLIGILVCQMIHVRNDTIKLTKKLSIKELDYNFDDKSNSIGTLLLHIATLEFMFLLNHFSYSNTSEDLFLELGKAVPLNMDKKLIYGNNFDYYLNYLNMFRNESLKNLKLLTDDWLFKTIKDHNGKELGNYYYLLRHIIDDEISHQGQIKLILKRL